MAEAALWEAREHLSRVEYRLAAACRRSGRDVKAVTLVGAAKTVSAGRLALYLEAGLREIGENYAQEALTKRGQLAELAPDAPWQKQARWHFIGSLQRNKVRQVVGQFHLIHSVDRASLAQAIQLEAARLGLVQDVLLQVNQAGESSKAGVALADLPELALQCDSLPNVRVLGLMTLPPLADEAQAMRPYFVQLRGALQELQAAGHRQMTHLSMGMTHDFEVAIEEGATLVRIGTGLFGSRPAGPH